jgi:hypothetical protein
MTIGPEELITRRPELSSGRTFLSGLQQFQKLESFRSGSLPRRASAGIFGDTPRRDKMYWPE